MTASAVPRSISVFKGFIRPPIRSLCSGSNASGEAYVGYDASWCREMDCSGQLSPVKKELSGPLVPNCNSRLSSRRMGFSSIGATPTAKTEPLSTIAVFRCNAKKINRHSVSGRQTRRCWLRISQLRANVSKGVGRQCPSKHRKNFVFAMLSELRHGAERSRKIYEELGQASQNWMRVS